MCRSTQRRHCRVGDIPIELANVEPHTLCIGAKCPRIQESLVREERVVHLPKTPLRGSGFSPSCCNAGVRVIRNQREMAERKPQRPVELGEQHLEHRVRSTTLKTLEVGVHEQRDRSVLGALRVVPVVACFREIQLRRRGQWPSGSSCVNGMNP